MPKMPVFFHHDQLNHKPLYEWAFGEKIPHPETTFRAESILAAIEQEPDLFELIPPVSFPLKSIKGIHNERMVRAIRASSSLPMDQTFYPSVFPYHRDKSNLDPNNIHHAGAFCFDSGTPLTSTTYASAAWSAACAYEAARTILEQRSKIAYALCRPPGHHASRDLFGGYCYFNNAALAAKVLRTSCARVAVLDIDFHHGNGTQVIFYRDPSVLVVNMHGTPEQFYPYFTGFDNELGMGAGKGFNINIPLAAGTDGQEYARYMQSEALATIRSFAPEALVLSAGLDTYAADPIGAFCLETHDFQKIGELIADLKLPTVIVQEGGYESTSLGRNVASLLSGFT